MMGSDDFAAARRAMVEQQLAARGIADPRVLAVMGAVPREAFIPADLAGSAYEDRALPIDAAQTISQPYIVALMSESLQVEPHHRVLEIGTGTGYQTAVLARLAAQVYSIERIESLSAAAQRVLARLGVANVSFRVGDGTLGWPEAAPFDRIMVTAAAPKLVDPLVAQLAEGGRMVIPLGEDAAQQLVTIERAGVTTIERPLIPVRFVRLIGASGHPE
ncbi:MAG TPA: protein-L-isoaspartate(D-aspartate) O-methyltransferase [Phycisphaerae bacterium]|nr:protein-L-isoaspartate(D-aspartate) O-methyltransferase [Phycisphaerae bacterium]